MVFYIQFEYLWIAYRNKFAKNICNRFIKRKRTHDELLNNQQHSDLYNMNAIYS